MCCRRSARCVPQGRQSTHESPRTGRTRCPPRLTREVRRADYSTFARERATMAAPDEAVGPPRRTRMRLTRRGFLKLSGAGAVAATVRLDAAPARAQSGSVRLGILAAKAGVLAPV